MSDTNIIKQKSVNGAISYFVRTGLVYLIAIVATALLSAYLSPEQFGIFFIVTSIVTFFAFLSDLGLAAALVQKKAEPTLAELRTTFTVQQLLSLTIFSLIVFLTPVWQTYTKLNQEGLWLLYTLGFSFLLASLKTIPSILLERNLDFGKLAVPQVAEQLVYYGIVVWCASRGWGVTSFTFGVLARGITGVLIMYGLKRWPIGLSLNKAALQGLLKFGVKFQINDLLARLKDDLYFIVLARFLPPAEIGYLGWAKRWSMFPYQFTVQNMIAISFPTYARLQDHKRELVRAIEKSMFFITLGIFPILAGMAIMAFPLTMVFPSYEKWQPALPALVLFCINIAFAAMTSPLTNTLNAIGKIDKTLRLMIMWTSLTWVLTPVSLRYFGYNGVALVSALVSVTSIIALVWVKRLLPIEYGRTIWRQILATGVMSLVLLGGLPLWQKSFWWLIMGILTGAAVYIAFMAAIGYSRLRQEILSLLKHHD